MKLHPLVTLGILSIAPALADEESAKEMEMLISGLPYIGTAPSSAIGTNLDGDSVFTNMQSAITNDQFFLRWVGMVQYENPTAAVATPAGIYWCSNIEPSTHHFFSDVPPAYSALCLYAPVKDQADQIATSGADLAELCMCAFSSTNSYSAIFVPALNAMEGGTIVSYRIVYMTCIYFCAGCQYVCYCSDNNCSVSDSHTHIIYLFLSTFILTNSVAHACR